MSNYCSATIPLKGDITKAKNKALRQMLTTDKDYFFLVEGNCEVLDYKVYGIFIEASKETGIEALMWARGEINQRLPFDDDRFVHYYKDFVSSFSMYTRHAVETVGFMDEKMPKNTWQDLEYAKRIGDAGLSSPFGIFASPKNVDQYFKITRMVDEFKNLKQMEEALLYWEEKDPEDFPINRRPPKPELKTDPIPMI